MYYVKACLKIKPGSLKRKTNQFRFDPSEPFHRPQNLFYRKLKPIFHEQHARFCWHCCKQRTNGDNPMKNAQPRAAVNRDRECAKKQWIMKQCFFEMQFETAYDPPVH